MKKLLVSGVLVFVLVAACDFNNPLMGYIEDATGTAKGIDSYISPDSFLMSNGITAIPVGEQITITIPIRNLRNYKLDLELEGDYPAGAKPDCILNDDGDAIITIDNPARNETFDLTLHVIHEGRPMSEYKLPKMEALYLNTELEEVTLTYTRRANGAVVPATPSNEEKNTDYLYIIPPSAKSFEITPTLPEDMLSTYKIDGLDVETLIKEMQEGIEYDQIHTITVIADCGKTQNYTIRVFVRTGASKDILSFSLEIEGETVEGEIKDIDESTGEIHILVHPSAVLTSLTPTISHSGDSIDPDPNEAKNFGDSTSVEYTVTADDDTTKKYKVIVTRAAAQIDTTLYATLAKAIDAAPTTATLSNPTTITLLGNITVPEGDKESIDYRITKHIQLVTNTGYDFTITRTSSVFTIENGSSLTLSRTSSSGTLTITGNEAGVNGACIAVNNGGTLVMHAGASLTGNKNISSTLTGGAVFVAGGGTFTMNGGTIKGNTATLGNGVSSSGTFNMTGGSIDDVVVVTNSTTLSGSASIDTITLRPITIPSIPNLNGISVAVGSGFTGKVNKLNLYQDNSDINSVITYWTGNTIIRAATGHTLTQTDIDRFVPGDFLGSTSGGIPINGNPVASGNLNYDIILDGDPPATPTGVLKSIGKGLSGDPFLIYTTAQMQRVGKGEANTAPGYDIWTLDANYRLENDISLSGLEWKPIGTATAPFKGTFDGNSKIITGLTINVSSGGDQGLFGVISGGTVEKLGLEGVLINASNSIIVGGVAGSIKNNSKVDRCFVTGTINGNVCVGGVVGEMDTGTVSNSYSTGKITGGSNIAGGIVGNAINSAYIGNCYSTATVLGYNRVGGIVGVLETNSTMINCIALNDSVTATTTTGNNAGRVAGDPTSTSTFTLTNNYARDDMAVNKAMIDDGEGDNRHGENIEIDNSPAMNSVFKESDGWSTTIWELPTNALTEGARLPTLMNLTPSTGHIPTLPDSELPVELEGEGTESEPYLISKPRELRMIGQESYTLDKWYELTADIDMAGRTWTKIGTTNNEFTGVFEGGGFKIKNLTFTDAGNGHGFFGYINGDGIDTGIVRNLGLENIAIEIRANQVGGVVGQNQGGLIENCYVTGKIAGNHNVGGIAGSNSGTVKNCYSTANITSTSNAGGLVGGNSVGINIGETNYQLPGLVTNSYATGTVNATSTSSISVGGIVGGTSASNSSLENCVALNPSLTINNTGSNNSVPYCIVGNQLVIRVNNKARQDMVLTPLQTNPTFTVTSQNGAHVALGTPLSEVFAGWNETIWNIPSEGTLTENGALPTLIGLPPSSGQEPKLPAIE